MLILILNVKLKIYDIYAYPCPLQIFPTTQFKDKHPMWSPQSNSEGTPKTKKGRFQNKESACE